LSGKPGNCARAADQLERRGVTGSSSLASATIRFSHVQNVR
jgi:hypothetical protein